MVVPALLACLRMGPPVGAARDPLKGLSVLSTRLESSLAEEDARAEGIAVGALGAPAAGAGSGLGRGGPGAGSGGRRPTVELIVGADRLVAAAVAGRTRAAAAADHRSDLLLAAPPAGRARSVVAASAAAAMAAVEVRQLVEGVEDRGDRSRRHETRKMENASSTHEANGGHGGGHGGSHGGSHGGGHDVCPPLPRKGAVARGVMIFYAGLTVAAFAVALLVAYDVRGVGAPTKRVLKRISGEFANSPRVASGLSTFIFFGLADCFAQITPAYWCGHVRFWDWRSTLAVALTSALVHGFLLNLLLERGDRWLGMEAAHFASTAVWRAVILQAGYLLVYLPVAALAFGLLAGMLQRTLADACECCVIVSILDVPQNIAAVGGLQTERLVDTLTASGLFWTPGHLATYLLVTRWAPEARAAADGAVTLLWNVLVAATCASKGGGGSGGHANCAGPAAVGPLLSGLAPGPAEGVLPTVDCERWTVRALAVRFYKLVCWLCGLVWRMLRACMTAVRDRTWAFVVGIYRAIASAVRCVWFCTCTLIKSTLSLVRLLLFTVVFLVWKILGAPFWLWDKVKWIGVVTALVPAPFPYEAEPYNAVPLWPWPGARCPNATLGGANGSAFLCCCRPW